MDGRGRNSRITMTMVKKVDSNDTNVLSVEKSIIQKCMNKRKEHLYSKSEEKGGVSIMNRSIDNISTSNIKDIGILTTNCKGIDTNRRPSHVNRYDIDPSSSMDRVSRVYNNNRIVSIPTYVKSEGISHKSTHRDITTLDDTRRDITSDGCKVRMSTSDIHIVDSNKTVHDRFNTILSRKQCINKDTILMNEPVMKKGNSKISPFIIRHVNKRDRDAKSMRMEPRKSKESIDDDKGKYAYTQKKKRDRFRVMYKDLKHGFIDDNDTVAIISSERSRYMII